MKQREMDVRAAARLRRRINWHSFPKLREIFEHRPPENEHWLELAELVDVELEEAFSEAAKQLDIVELRRVGDEMAAALRVGAGRGAISDEDRALADQWDRINDSEVQR